MNSIRVRVKQTLGERFRPRVLQVIVRVTFNRIDSVVHSAVFFSFIVLLFFGSPLLSRNLF